MLATDRRSVLIATSAAGRRRAAAVHRELAALERDVLAKLGGGAKAGFDEVVAALERVAGATAAVKP